MTTWYAVTITAQQPVSLGRSGSRAYLTPTHPFIPGSVVRGALAGAWIAKHGTPDDRFVSTFEHSVRFGPAMPPRLRIVPQSMVTCKYHDFTLRGEGRHESGYDKAFDATLPNPCTSWEKSTGAPSWDGISAATSSALRPGTLQVAESQLFSRETLPAGTKFSGHLVVEGTIDERLLCLPDVVVGGRGSVLGKAGLSITEAAAPEPPADQPWALVTCSPTLLVDEAGRPTLDPTFALSLAGVQSPARWWGHRVQTEGTGGWHIASGLPKPSEVAVAPGLVLRFDSPDPSDIRRLLDHGLGLRRQEGFGWLTVGGPWPAPTAPAQATPEDANSPTRAQLANVQGLQLSADVVRWLAGKLLSVSPGAQEQVDQAMWEPAVAAGHLTRSQRTSIKELLLSAPQDVRAGLVTALGEGS